MLVLFCFVLQKMKFFILFNFVRFRCFYGTFYLTHIFLPLFLLSLAVPSQPIQMQKKKNTPSTYLRSSALHCRTFYTNNAILKIVFFLLWDVLRKDEIMSKNQII